MLKLREVYRPGQTYRLRSGKYVTVIRVRQVNVTCRYLPDGSGCKPEEIMLTRPFMAKNATLVLRAPTTAEKQLDLFKGLV